ncbi:MAG: NAD(P)-dependent oxidoreductase [Pseudomonadota bacterium]
MARERFLITGASGCIGSAVLRQLVTEGADVVASDVRRDQTRPALNLTAAQLASLNWLELDVTDSQAVVAAVRDHAVTHIIHLAGLMIPFARANPPLGAHVNVTGTVNIFEAARHNGVRGLAYASSTAVFGPVDAYPPGRVTDDAPRLPETLYGVYKMANEETARVYWRDWQVGSVGLRPGAVFGVGRDQGVSAGPAKALLAVAAGCPYHIAFDGPIALQYTRDVAAMFIGCARAEYRGAVACNLRNDYLEVSEFVARILKAHPEARITHAEGASLPAAFNLDDARLRRILGTVPHTPLNKVITEEVEAFRSLVAARQVDLAQLDD